MTQSERIELVRVILQGIVAIVILVGGGALVFARPDYSAPVFGIVGAVVSYYFLSATQSNAVNSTLRSLEAQGVHWTSSGKAQNANGSKS